MNIAYCSLLLPEEKKLAERSKERLSGISGHKVTYATIMGIEANLSKPMTVFNIINTLNYPKFPQLIFKSEKWKHIKDAHDWHIGYINLFGIKYITQAINLYRKLEKWVKMNNDEKSIICVHHIYLPSMIAAIMVKRKYKDKVTLCLNTGDVPGKFGLESKSNAIIKDYLIKKVVDENIMKLAKKFDCFVFVTKQMADAFGVNDKPFTVVECVYQDEQKDIYVEESLKDEKNKTIFYAGALREEYGINHLLRAFSLIDDPNYRLVIAGGGSSESLVEEYAHKDNRIQFLGFISPKEVRRQQQLATVLISPRTSKYEYVKYSFPSKSVDSLASGKPYIAHKLPCDPPEYGKYIQYAKDESDEALAEKIIEICNLSKEERLNIGQNCKDFILKKKKPEILCKRVLEMWEKIQ